MSADASKKLVPDSATSRELLREPQLHSVPCGPAPFSRVPTHAVRFPVERRLHARAALNLPLRLHRVGGQIEPTPLTLLTRDISSSGVFFLAPKPIAPGTPIELEVALVDRPLGQGSVRMCTAAHVVRSEPASSPGWHAVAATFDDIAFDRDEPVPNR
ncbi:MAG TPA: PilZ domain-containing protein [Terriglobia bacterium]|jgi:hypothetical protein